MMMWGKEREREMTSIPLNVWSSGSSVVSSICCCSNLPPKGDAGVQSSFFVHPVVVDDDDGFEDVFVHLRGEDVVHGGAGGLTSINRKGKVRPLTHFLTS